MERLAEHRQQIGGAIDRLAKLEAAQSTRVHQRLAATRLRHLREVLDAPDLSEVRAALRDLIVGIEACPDGSFWLLIGEGRWAATTSLGCRRTPEVVTKPPPDRRGARGHLGGLERERPRPLRRRTGAHRGRV